MTEGGQDDVDHLIAGLALGHTGVSRASIALANAEDDRLREALLDALLHGPNPATRRGAAQALGRPWDKRREARVTDALVVALDDPEPIVRRAAMGALDMIALHDRTVRPRIVAAFRSAADNDPYEAAGHYPLREDAARLVDELGPSAAEIEEMQANPDLLNEQITGLQEALDRWVSTLYPSMEERRYALDELLAQYDRKPTVKSVALARLLDRLRLLAALAVPREGETRTKTSPFDRLELGTSDTREWRPPEEVDQLPPYGTPAFIQEREFEYDHGYYPRWLKRDLIDDAFPHGSAQPTTMARFLDRYTLQDSRIIGFWLDPTEGATLVIRWDPEGLFDRDELSDFWLGGKRTDPLAAIRYGYSPMVSWPVLVIKIVGVYHLWQEGDLHAQGRGEFSDVYSASTDPVSEEMTAAIEAMRAVAHREDDRDEVELLPADIQKTVILGVGGYELRLIHDARVYLLCVDRAGVVLQVPDLEMPPADV